MDTLPTIKLYNIKPDEYIYAVFVIKWMMEHGNLPETIGVYRGTTVSTAYGDWYVWKTRPGYSIQKENNK